MTSKLSAAIRAGLHQKGMSQSGLAENIGVSNNTVTSWVKDRHLPDKESLTELKRFFDWREGKIVELLEDWFENSHGEKNYRIAGHEFVASKYNGDYEAFLTDLIALDEATIAGICSEHEGTPQQWAPIFFHSPYTWRIIVNGDEIVGYWQFVCVKDTFYKAILEGSIVDSEISVEMLDFPVVEGRYKAYMPIIAVRSQDRGATTLNLLLSALSKTLTDLAKNDILIEDCCATNFSFEGKRLCELIGMEHVHRHPRAPSEGLADVFRITGPSVANSFWGKKSPVIREKYRAGFM